MRGAGQGHASAVATKRTSGNMVCCVEVLHDDGKKVSYKIVSPENADISRKLYSSESPFGHALVGADVGQEVTIKVPVGEIHVTVQKISFFDISKA